MLVKNVPAGTVSEQTDVLVGLSGVRRTGPKVDA